MKHRALRVPLLPPAKDYNRWFVRVAICGRDGKPVWATALIDTGASAVCISKRLADRCKATIVPKRKTRLLFVHRVLRTQLAGVWLAVRRDVVDTTGVLIVHPWIEDSRRSERAHDAVIGSDWLEKHRAVLDFGRRTMTIRVPVRKGAKR